MFQIIWTLSRWALSATGFLKRKLLFDLFSEYVKDQHACRSPGVKSYPVRSPEWGASSQDHPLAVGAALPSSNMLPSSLYFVSPHEQGQKLLRMADLRIRHYLCGSSVPLRACLADGASQLLETSVSLLAPHDSFLAPDWGHSYLPVTATVCEIIHFSRTIIWYMLVFA